MSFHTLEVENITRVRMNIQAELFFFYVRISFVGLFAISKLLQINFDYEHNRIDRFKDSLNI